MITTSPWPFILVLHCSVLLWIGQGYCKIPTHSFTCPTLAPSSKNAFQKHLIQSLLNHAYQSLPLSFQEIKNDGGECVQSGSKCKWLRKDMMKLKHLWRDAVSPTIRTVDDALNLIYRHFPIIAADNALDFEDLQRVATYLRTAVLRDINKQSLCSDKSATLVSCSGSQERLANNIAEALITFIRKQCSQSMTTANEKSTTDFNPSSSTRLVKRNDPSHSRTIVVVHPDRSIFYGVSNHPDSLFSGGKRLPRSNKTVQEQSSTLNLAASASFPVPQPSIATLLTFEDSELTSEVASDIQRSFSSSDHRLDSSQPPSGVIHLPQVVEPIAPHDQPFDIQDDDSPEITVQRSAPSQEDSFRVSAFITPFDFAQSDPDTPPELMTLREMRRFRFSWPELSDCLFNLCFVCAVSVLLLPALTVLTVLLILGPQTLQDLIDDAARGVFRPDLHY